MDGAVPAEDGPERTPIRVMMVDDHNVVRQGLRTYAEILGDITIVEEAATGPQALERLATLEACGRLPHVVLMDLMLPFMDGIAATAAIKARYPAVEVVLLTGFITKEKVHAALQAGAVGYVLKDATPDEVGAAIRAAQRGEVHLNAAVAGPLMQSLRGPAAEGTAVRLTDRERDVLVLVGQGLSNKEIAGRLGIGNRTVRTHVSGILGKLGLASRTQAALFAVRAGLAPTSDTP